MAEQPMVYVCWEGIFDDTKIICVFTDEERAKQWKREPTGEKHAFRDYDAVPLMG